MGLRLPLATLPWVLPEERDPDFDVDPFAPRAALPTEKKRARSWPRRRQEPPSRASRPRAT